jgi:anti-sigma B factor antagonist
VAPDFNLSSAYVGANAQVLTVAGDLDVATAPALQAELVRASEERANQVVVDLLGVPFIDSVGLGILVEAAKRLKARGGRLRFVCEDRRVARVIEITGLGGLVRLHPTLREALESLEQTAAVR